MKANAISSKLNSKSVLNLQQVGGRKVSEAHHTIESLLLPASRN